MGSPPEEKGRYDDEGPQREVTIPKAIAVGRYEVRFDEWALCVQDGACPALYDEGFGRGARPAINVSFDDARAYAQWLSKKSGKNYRLLSEAEWEYAARAGTSTARFWGENPDRACPHANVADETAKRRMPQSVRLIGLGRFTTARTAMLIPRQREAIGQTTSACTT